MFGGKSGWIIFCKEVWQMNKLAKRLLIITTYLLLLQPSTALANQLPGQLVSTQIRITKPNYFKFIIALIMTSTNIVYIDE